MSRKKQVTAADLAGHVGVSRSTVSRAFSGDGYVKREVRDRILEAAREIGYQPNALARALISDRSNIVGVLTGDLSQPVHAMIYSMLTTSLHEAGLVPIAAQIGEGSPIEEILATFRQYQAKSVLITSMAIKQSMIRSCQDYDLHTVFLNRVDEEGISPSVSADLVEGGRRAAAHIAECGCRNVAVIEGIEGLWTTRARLAGHLKGLGDHGLSPTIRLNGGFSYEGGARAAMELSKAGVAIDGVLCANDATAMGFLDAYRRVDSVNFPEELAIIGFDDIPMANWLGYQLTTVRLPMKRMIAEITRQLSLFAKSGDPFHEEIAFPCRLVERQTRQTRNIGTQTEC